MVSYEQSHRHCRQCGGSTMHYRKATNHVLHFLITVLSCGWWALAWLALSLKIGGWRCKECGAGGWADKILVGAVAALGAVVVVPLAIGLVMDPSPAPSSIPPPRSDTAELAGRADESLGLAVEPMAEAESAEPVVVSSVVAAAPGPSLPDTVPSTPVSLPEPEPQLPALRTWTDTSGQFRLQADFVSYGLGQVKLKKADGSVIVIPMERLSEEDQRWIRKRGK